MAGSGSAWVKPSKRTGLRPTRLTDRPHPTFVRGGQRYFPRRRSGKNRVTIKITRVLAGEKWDGVRDDGRPVRVTGAALLATGEDGQGRYYRFVGYSSRRYDTHGVVIETGPAWTRLVLPEWHPALPVTVGTGSLSPAAREPGAWVRCRANLGAERPAHLEVDRIVSAEEGFDSGRYPSVAVAPPAPASAGELPPHGPGCGDIVLFVSAAEAEALASGRSHEIYVTGHPPPVAAGGRAYLYRGGQVVGWRRLAGRQLRPNGTVLSFDESWEPCAVSAAIERPASGVAEGEHGSQKWVWRDWRREAEGRMAA